MEFDVTTILARLAIVFRIVRKWSLGLFIAEIVWRAVLGPIGLIYGSKLAHDWSEANELLLHNIDPHFDIVILATIAAGLLGCAGYYVLTGVTSRLFASAMAGIVLVFVIINLI